MTARLVVRDLRKAYGDVRAVAGVSFTVAPGEVYGLLGPNGAGKTTTIEAVVGLVEPDLGELLIGGLPARDARVRVGVALQSTALQDAITPREALRLFAALYRVGVAPEPLLERFGLLDKADAAFRSLSGGQKQRLALALAFVNDPDLVILDEPTAGLDPLARRELHDHVRAMRDEGRAVLIATHDIDEAERLCDRVAIIDRGRVVGEGSPRELTARSGGVSRAVIELDAPVEIGAPPSSVTELRAEGSRIHFNAPDLGRALADLLPLLDARSVRVMGVHAGRSTLEEVIAELAGGAGR